MSVKYMDRLNIPVIGDENLHFQTTNGLSLAVGYERVVFDQKKPQIEFSEAQIDKKNIHVPEVQKWRITHKSSEYIEYRSNDYCNVKIIQWKINPDKFYISPFDLKTDKILVIQRLNRKKTRNRLD